MRALLPKTSILLGLSLYMVQDLAFANQCNKAQSSEEKNIIVYPANVYYEGLSSRPITLVPFRPKESGFHEVIAVDPAQSGQFIILKNGLGIQILPGTNRFAVEDLVNLPGQGTKFLIYEGQNIHRHSLSSAPIKAAASDGVGLAVLSEAGTLRIVDEVNGETNYSIPLENPKQFPGDCGGGSVVKMVMNQSYVVVVSTSVRRENIISVLDRKTNLMTSIPFTGKSSAETLVSAEIVDGFLILKSLGTDMNLRRYSALKLQGLQIKERPQLSLKSFERIQLAQPLLQSNSYTSSKGIFKPQIEKDGRVRIIDASNGRKVGEFQHPTISNGNPYVGISKNGEMAIVSSYLGRKWWFSVIETKAGQILGTNISLPDGAHYSSFDISPDNQLLALGTDSGEIYLVEINTGKILISERNNLGVVSTIRFSDDGKRIVISDPKRNSISIRDTKDFSIIHEFRTFDVVNDAEFSRDGNLLLISNSYSVRLVDAITGKILIEYKLDQKIINGTISPDGKNIALATNQGEIIILDVRTSSIQAKIPLHENIGNIKFSSDGDLIVTLFYKPEVLRLDSSKLLAN